MPYAVPVWIFSNLAPFPRAGFSRVINGKACGGKFAKYWFLCWGTKKWVKDNATVFSSSVSLFTKTVNEKIAVYCLYIKTTFTDLWQTVKATAAKKERAGWSRSGREEKRQNRRRRKRKFGKERNSGDLGGRLRGDPDPRSRPREKLRSSQPPRFSPGEAPDLSRKFSTLFQPNRPHS